MDNTIPFNPTSCTVRTEQITVDVSILSVLNHAASPGRHKPDANIYLAAIAPDMELTIIMEEDAPHILPCFDEEDATITIKGAPLFISYNPAQVLTLAGKHYLTGAVIFYRTDSSGRIVSLTVEELIIFRNTHEPIITQEVWDAAQKLRKRSPRKLQNGTYSHRLSGLIFCADCGHRMSYKSPDSVRRPDNRHFDSDSGFQCVRYRNRYDGCTSHSIKVCLRQPRSGTDPQAAV